jgi:hypothetical protein
MHTTRMWYHLGRTWRTGCLQDRPDLMRTMAPEVSRDPCQCQGRVFFCAPNTVEVLRGMPLRERSNGSGSRRRKKPFISVAADRELSAMIQSRLVVSPTETTDDWEEGGPCQTHHPQTP